MRFAVRIRNSELSTPEQRRGYAEHRITANLSCWVSELGGERFNKFDHITIGLYCQKQSVLRGQVGDNCCDADRAGCLRARRPAMAARPE